MIPGTQDCSSTRPAFSFSIQRAWMSATSNNIHNEGTPLAGDIDGDGKVEIVAMSADGYKVYIFEGETGDVAGVIQLDVLIVSPSSYDVSFPGLICDIDGNGKAEVFIVSALNSKMFLYEVSSAPGVRPITFSPKWVDKPVSITAFVSWGGLLPIIADFEGDGNPEMIVEGQVVDAQTGNIMTTLPLMGKGSWGLVTVPTAADVDGDGLPEILVGTDIYKYAAGSYTLYARCPSYASAQEGVAMAADINQDGILDVVYSDSQTSTNTVVVWTPSTNTVIGTFSFATSNGVSYPFIGDIDGAVINGKKYPEICINTAYILYSYYFDGTDFQQKWTMSHTDRSAATSLTLFDFNLDGTVELVYRDETTVRIFDGSGSAPVLQWSAPCYSVTTTEAPIIADVTGDGSANIVVTGRPTSEYVVGGEVMVFEGGESKWASCPRVWNQQQYSNLTINNDLTIPTSIQMPNLTFYLEDGSPIQYYNGGPMQAPYISDVSNLPIDLAPDLFVVNGTISISGTQVTLSVTLGNQGMAEAAGNTPIQFYKNAIATGNILQSTTLGADVSGAGLFPGQTRVITRTFTLSPMPAQFYIRAVDDGTNFPALGAFSDCNLTNNTKSFGTIELTKEVSQLSGCIGSTSVFTVKLRNNELSSFSNIQLIDSLSPGWQFVSAEATTGTTVGAYNPTTRSFTWTVPSLPQGSEVQLTIIANTITSGTDRNTVWVSSVGGAAVARDYKFAYVVVSTDPAPAAPSITPAGTISFCSDRAISVPLHASGAGVTYQWYRNNTLIAGATTANYTATQTGSYFATLFDGTCFSSMSNTVYITRSFPTMYWSTLAADNNWNNPDNWVDASGTHLNAVPGSCTTVHIPGEARAFPALDSTSTPRAGYGPVTCDNIVFHFGGELAQPHYLTYNKAYVQYNYGYYNAAHVLQTDWDPISAAPMERGRWYALAAPLKSVVTGDFAFGGYPNTWQQGFKTSRDRSGSLTGGWYTPEPTTALELGMRQNYAICLYVPEYDNAVSGVSDHQHLDALHGVIELPYFENATADAHHPLHTYTGGVSQIYYYSGDDFSLLSDHDDITRASEAYRFIFENNLDQPQDPFKISVPVVDSDGDSQIDEVMIANPFLSSLDFDVLYSVNSTLLEPYYRLYRNAAFETRPLLTGGLIAPMQAFFVKPIGTLGTEVEIKFTKAASVARTETHQL
ncbi:MAG: DUF11 domain-containing protein, partial [Dysgonamonadaceae bacterium]|nr:DUF11 domain-containing protein [Dysgonamonadaceae bacterium]